VTTAELKAEIETLAARIAVHGQSLVERYKQALEAGAETLEILGAAQAAVVEGVTELARKLQTLVAERN
jgi:hypothetical protein